MTQRTRLLCTFFLTLSLPMTSVAGDKPSLSNLSLEVSAMQTIQRFQLTTKQLETLRKLASETMPKNATREDGKGSAKLRKTLTDLRAALLKDDDDSIDSLSEQLETLLADDETDLDDTIDLTTAARRRASEFLLTLSPRQVAGFLAAVPDVPDPLERLLEALDVVGSLKDDQWKDLTDDIAEDLGWQLGGVDLDRGRKVSESIRQYLTMVRSLNEKDFKKQRADLEKSARQFVTQAPPTIVLHNMAEYDLAELLSNPRLSAAIDAMQKK
jgi:hypothetical protein